jgi:tripartite-type tricarboxylate transporter receptor subunit TctC
MGEGDLHYLCRALLLVVFAAVSSAAVAETYPNRPIRWIVPYAAGGGSDALARMIQPELSKRLGVPLVIENKPGAASAIAASEVARSAPDGYTILNADIGTLVYNPALFKKLSYDPSKDFRPVSLLIRLPTILVVGPGTQATSVKELFDTVKAQPGKISYGSAGAGSPHAMAMELVKAKVGLDMIHVPYRGGALSLQDVASGQIPMTMTDFAGGGGMITSGKVRPLAVATPKRMEQLPNVPTFDELGYPGIHAGLFTGIVVPAGTPDDIVARLQKALQESVAEPSVRNRLIETGHEPIGSTAEQFSVVLGQETATWHKLIKDLNISLD